MPRSPQNRRGSFVATTAQLVPPGAGFPHLDSGGALSTRSLMEPIRDELGWLLSGSDAFAQVR